MNLLKIFKKQEKAKGRSYFDLPAREKKEIIKKAAEDAGKMQRDLIRKYDRIISTV